MNSDKFIQAVEGMNQKQRDIIWGMWELAKYFDDKPYVKWDDVEIVIADLLEEEKNKGDGKNERTDNEDDIRGVSDRSAFTVDPAE